MFQTIPAGIPFAEAAAQQVMDCLPREDWPRAVLLVPTRRAIPLLRDALVAAADAASVRLPRILPLADAEGLAFALYGAEALTFLAPIPPAMRPFEYRCLLARQVQAFEARRSGKPVTLAYAFALAESLMALQEQCARHRVTLSQARLRPLASADFATHWQQSLAFLSILTDHWPEVLAATGRIPTAAREVAQMEALLAAWDAAPPSVPVFALGSTGSQPLTAELLVRIARLPHGGVVVPGQPDAAASAPGQALYHIAALATRLGESPGPNLEPRSPIPEPRITLIPCAHAEEEARLVSLLIAEGLAADAKATVALVTPQEDFMARVAAHLRRFNIVADRMSHGTLAHTMRGSLWATLAAALRAPGRLVALRALLHHPLLGVDATLLEGLAEGWHGFNRRGVGKLPAHAESLRSHADYPLLARAVATLATLGAAHHTAKGWMAALTQWLAAFPLAPAQGEEAVADALAALADAELFGPLDAESIADLIDESLRTPWRDAGLGTHPRVAMLTPVEARLHAFDRVVIANLEDAVWPGNPPPNPWLNLAAQTALGLPAPAEHASLMAHDFHLLSAMPEVFCTYAERAGGGPVPRSRFLERLGFSPSADRATFRARAAALDAATAYTPATPPRPMPDSALRPHRLRVTDLDLLFRDPYSLYAREVLGLRARPALDASPEASDFGNLTHRAVEALTQHWNHTGHAADEATLSQLADQALRDFSEQPNVAYFWRERLRNGLHYLNRIEAERRAHTPLTVESERAVEGELTLGESTRIALYGRIDRIERQPNGARALVDYKTGSAPSEKDVLSGRALQLLAYAWLLGDAPAQTLEYWQLPRLGAEGEITQIAPDAATLAMLESALCAALRDMLDAKTPFLALAEESDYDGLTRRAEWA